MTICVKDRRRLFGDVRDGRLVLSEEGRIADEQWRVIPTFFPGVELDAYVFMPDHMHGILILNLNSSHTGTHTGPDTRTRTDTPPDTRKGLIYQTLTGDAGHKTDTADADPATDTGGAGHQTLAGRCPGDWILMKQHGVSLAKVVRAYKARTSRLVRLAGDDRFRWHRNYYEHIIRNNADLDRIRRYIANNPLRWSIERKEGRP